jgi:uracil-DNA glycosylase family 4
MTIDPHDQIANKMAGYREALCLSGSTRFVFGSGPVPPKAVILGGNPDGASASAGLPFYGVAGQMLTGFMERAGLWREDCYLTYLIKFQPDSTMGGGPGRAAEWRNASWPFLKKELKVIGKAHMELADGQKPCRLMMVMGTGPAVMLWGPDAAQFRSGLIRKVMIGKQEWTALLTLDISAAVSNGAAKAEIADNFVTLGGLANGSAAAPAF